jgi:hypothetical protein
MQSQLIDWVKVPVGALTNMGLIIGNHDESARVLSDILGIKEIQYTHLHIVEQTSFIHILTGAAPPVAEGLIIEYKYLVCMSGVDVVKFEKQYELIPS